MRATIIRACDPALRACTVHECAACVSACACGHLAKRKSVHSTCCEPTSRNVWDFSENTWRRNDQTSIPQSVTLESKPIARALPTPTLIARALPPRQLNLPPRPLALPPPPRWPRADPRPSTRPTPLRCAPARRTPPRRRALPRGTRAGRGAPAARDTGAARHGSRTRSPSDPRIACLCKRARERKGTNLAPLAKSLLMRRSQVLSPKLLSPMR